MACKYFFTFFVFIVIWACLIETTFGTAGWCYQCDSRDPRCQINMDPSTLSTYRIPCNGQCYIRVKDGHMSRGCSWEYGFMTRQLSHSPIFDQGAMWVFCDTALCNADANTSG